MYKYANIANLPPKRPRTDAFIQQTFAKPSKYPTIYCSETSYDLPNFYKTSPMVQNLPFGDAPYRDVKYGVASQAFCNGIKLAVQLGLDAFMWYEDDCWVKDVGWDEPIWAEFLNKPKALCAGFPCLWNPTCMHMNWELAMVRYAYKFQERSGIPVTFEGGPPRLDWRYKQAPFLYPNGAFGIYKTSMVVEAFKHALKDYAANTFELLYFDMAVGVHLSRGYGIDMYDLMIPVPCIYSGCGEDHVTHAMRKAMAFQGTKTGIHQWSFV